ncbi:conserved hypothetical protein [Desulfatibacillum aliphaticivorans]|uniref:Uncharacterized protein n=1 Tax=Desulfatibacillum aliphaticivorans TaxID=218208 RepID=B8FDD8_DESAL|nr:hypothetical protein [Desulfatibacillum aliphaticivorans]ACL06569.1 conserved hypothetical protein [Desulfatibacillum aliphaticivorans]
MQGQDATTQEDAKKAPPGNGKNGGAGRDPAMEKLAEKLLQTKEFKDMTGALMPEILKAWAGDSAVRKIISRQIAKTMEKGFLAKAGEDAPQVKLFEDMEFSEILMSKVPALVNTGIKGTGGLSKALDSLPDEKKQAYMAQALQAIDSASIGQTLATLIRIVNEVHETNPTFVSEQIQTPFQALVENLDFADLEDVIKHSQNDFVGIVRAINEVFDRYPSKVVCLLGLVPATFNVTVAILNEATSQLDNMPPDLLTEIILSLMGDIDGAAVGQAVNYLHELLRKIHTGSSLLGPPGHPQFTQELTSKLKEIVAAIDTQVWWKGRQAISEIRDAKENAKYALLQEHPDMLIQQLKESPVLLNSRIKALLTNVSLLEEMDDEAIAEAVAEGALRLDMQDLAEALNLHAQVANRIRKVKPDLAMSILESFSYSVDLDEVGETAQWLARDLADSFKPLVRSVFPPLVQGVCECLAPENDEHQEGIDNALNALRELLKPQEA